MRPHHEYLSKSFPNKIFVKQKIFSTQPMLSSAGSMKIEKFICQLNSSRIPIKEIVPLIKIPLIKIIVCSLNLLNDISFAEHLLIFGRSHFYIFLFFLSTEYSFSVTSVGFKGLNSQSISAYLNLILLFNSIFLGSIPS